MKFLQNRLHVIELYSMDSGQSTQVTDGMSDTRYPAFDRDGQYLYFTASTNYGPGSHPLDMTSDEHRVTRHVYTLVLPSDVESPVAPESDEEKGAVVKQETQSGDAPPKPVRVDFAGLAQRMVALPIPARDYRQLQAGRAGVLYLLEEVPENLRNRNQGRNTLSKFDLKTRKLERLAENVESFDVLFMARKCCSS
jgi:tricorn protease